MLKDIIKQYFVPRVRETFNPTKFSPRETASPFEFARFSGRIGEGEGREKRGDSGGNH